MATCERKAINGDKLILKTRTADEYRKLTALLDTEIQNRKLITEIGQLQYHTYQAKSDKPFVVYIRHLHSSTPITEITEELSKVGHEARRIVNVQIRKKVESTSSLIKLPLFRVELEPKENNRDILDLYALSHTRIHVELPRTRGEIPQCKNCQEIGHSQNYCRQLPRCVKCGENHHSKACTKPKEEKGRCANCKGEHTANYKGCRIYQEKLHQQNKPRMTASERLRVSDTKNITYAQAAATKDTNITVSTLATTPSKPSDDTPTLADLVKIIQSLQTSFQSSLNELGNRLTNLEELHKDFSPRKRKRNKNDQHS